MLDLCEHGNCDACDSLMCGCGWDGDDGDDEETAEMADIAAFALRHGMLVAARLFPI
jgi:hypothetical protein